MYDELFHCLFSTASRRLRDLEPKNARQDSVIQLEASHLAGAAVEEFYIKIIETAQKQRN